MVKATPDPTCPHCRSRELYVTVKPIAAGRHRAPDLLPGLHPWYRSGSLHAVICVSCGLHRQFADADARQRLGTSPKWRRL
jgi:hypothetical protein